MSALASGADKLGEFDHDARLLDLETFRALHGEAFLIHYGALDALSPASALRGTVNNEALRVDGGWLYQYFVFRLRKAPGEGIDAPISIGRTSENDVVIDDESLSRRHALVSPVGYAERSPWVIRDLGSTNGTFVDDQRLLREAPTTVVTGSRIRFGGVEVTFLLAREFCTLVQRLTPGDV